MMFLKGRFMIKKRCLIILGAFCIISSVKAEDVIKKLPEPIVSGGKPIMDVIRERKTDRTFINKEVDEQLLSEMLYSAWGISHDGKRTIPTARNKQGMNVYVARADGVWLYDAANNSLKQVSADNILPFFAQQDFMKNVPLVLIYTDTDEKYGAMHAGSAYQNVGLYAAYRNLHNVVRGMFDKEAVAKALNVKPEEVLITQAIGWGE